MKNRPNTYFDLEIYESSVMSNFGHEEANSKFTHRVHERIKKEHMSRFPIVLPNSESNGLSHFMELEERKDLLSGSTIADDPLGAVDDFTNFQWVEVKKEIPDDVEISKVTLLELPLEEIIQSEESASQEKHCDNLNEIQQNKEKTHFQTKQNIMVTKSNQDNNSVTQDESSYLDNECFNASIDTIFEECENYEENSIGRRKSHSPRICDICGKTLSSTGSLRLHKFKRHQLKSQFYCDMCDLKFESYQQVIKHRNKDHKQKNGRFGCEVCNKQFSNYHILLRHIKIHITIPKEDQLNKICELCDKPFHDNKSLAIHYVFVHGKGNNTEGETLKHLEKNLVCDTCGKRFAFNCLLWDHINTHTGNKPYSCLECDKSFAQKSTLKQHKKTHTGIRPFQCLECTSSFRSKGDLKKHVRRHTGERPYKCEVCGEAFSRNSHLSVHRRSHTGERPFCCEECGRGFTKQGDLVRHRRIHSGELPYLCQVCGRGFRQSAQCANHLKSHHPTTTTKQT